MSLWADARIRELLARVAALEHQNSELKELITPRINGEPSDKRTREWREWKNANSSHS